MSTDARTGSDLADIINRAVVIDFDAIRSSGISIGVDPLGGSSVAYWQAIAELYRLNLTVIRDTVEEAEKVAREIGERNGGSRGPGLVGPPERLAEHFAPYLELGFRHIYIDVPAPYDRETIKRFVGEVKPLLERG